MLARKIRCFVVRIPEEDSGVPPQAAWREALPWADPYILGLIRKLQDEVRQERAARWMSAREADEAADQPDWEVELDGLTLEPEPAPHKPTPAACAAADGSPPTNIVKADPRAEDEGEWHPHWQSACWQSDRPVRRPR